MKRYLLLILFAACLVLPVPCAKPAEPQTLAVEQVEPKKTPAKDDLPTIVLPKTLSGDPGIPIRVIAETNGANVRWLTPDKGLVVIDGGFFNGDSKRAVLFGPTGKYRLWAVSAKGDAVSETAECAVTIGEPGPGPGPGPGPLPPTDPLVKAFQDAYDGEMDRMKRPQQLAALTELYGKLATLVNDPNTKTSNQLLTAAHSAAEVEVGKAADGALMKVRDAVRVYLNTRLSRSDMPLDGAAKATAVDAFTKINSALKGVKP